MADPSMPYSRTTMGNLNWVPPWARKKEPDYAELIKGLFQDYQTGWDEAQKANLGRYEEIKGGYQKRIEDVLALMENMGTTERGRINEQFTGAGTRAQQGLVSSGLAGTTAAGGVMAGVERQRSSALQELAERISGRKASTMAGLQGDLLGFMERRQDEYPEAPMMLQMATLLGKYGNKLQGSDYATLIRELFGKMAG